MDKLVLEHNRSCLRFFTGISFDKCDPIITNFNVHCLDGVEPRLITPDNSLKMLSYLSREFWISQDSVGERWANILY